MSWQIEQLDRHGARRALPAMVRAFWDYEESVHLLPRVRNRRRVLPQYLMSDMMRAASHQVLFGAVRSAGVMGAAAWVPPHAYPEPASAQVRQALQLVPCLPWGVGALREALRGRRENRRHHARFPPHYFLAALGVEPGQQGTGCGSALLTPVLARADAEGVGCFLFTAAQANTGWYGRFGFVVSAVYRPTATWPVVWAMWREPAPVDGPPASRTVRPD